MSVISDVLQQLYLVRESGHIPIQDLSSSDLRGSSQFAFIEKALKGMVEITEDSSGKKYIKITDKGIRLHKEVLT